MSEELLQRDLIKNPSKIGKWDFYNIGATNVKALKEYGIIRNVNYGTVEKKKIDALIVQKKNVIAVIEYKKPSEFKTEVQKNKAIEQEVEVAQKLGANIFIATDTQETVWVNALTGNRIGDENGKEIKTLFDPKSESIAELIKKINESINEESDNIKPRNFINPTNLAKSIWQDIWSVSGATPENCLYTFVELFIFKYLSDLEVLQEPENFEYLMNLYNKRDKEFVLEYYANNVRPKIKDLFPPDAEDKTTIINGTIFVSKDQKAIKGYSTTFKTVLDKFEKYGKLENVDYDFKSKLFESFLKESISKKNWGQFFTPLKVIRPIIEMAKDEIKEGVKICDPACGVGKFLLEPLVTRLEDFYKISKNGIIPKIEIHGFDKGFDKDEQKTIILAKANMLIYFSDLIKENPGQTQAFAQLFNQSFTLKTNSILGTLSDPVEDEYDLILTNPPYVTSGSGNLKDEIKKDGDLVNYYKVNAMGVEGLFMEWIVKALKPGGKAFIVVPDGILNRQNDKNLRQYILDECYIDGVISLPIKTFFTTPKKTYILAITKKIKKNDTQIDPVFTYLVSEIGETRDIYRFDTDQNDLQEAVTLYSFFKGNKKEFEKINSDKRCKIQSISKFDSNSHWSVDRWWTKEEQIKLGILEEDKTVDIKEFGELIGDMSESLTEFSQLLKEFDEKKNLKNNYREVSIADKQYFDFFIGKRLVKKDLVKINGSIPIYSANVFTPVGSHFESNIDNFENNFVIWGIDGDFEFNFIEKYKPFVTTDHCGTIRILNDDVLPEYLMLQLTNAKHKYGFDRGLRSSLKNMAQVFVSLPFDLEGNIDVQIQKEMLEKYQVVKETKQKVEEYKKKIGEFQVEIKNESQNSKLMKINDIFDIVSGYAFKKSLFTGNSSDVPIIRIQNISEKRPSFVYYPKLEKINDKFLVKKDDYLLPLSGSFFRLTKWKEDGKFYLNQRVAKFSMKHDFVDKLDENFIKTMINVIEDRIYSMGYSANNNLRIGDVENIEIQIPLDQEGEFDLLAQKEIADKYKKIENIKLSITKKLEEIFQTEIEL
ncbi:MAG: N-6 DNA methylase [Candidatus Magasanikbacteria bacterium]|nr:N-6 DNA methylase [Candidatus Magasanikbacteria bacterium]